MKKTLGILLLLIALCLPQAGGAQAHYRPRRHTHRVWVTGYLWTGNRTADGSWPHWGTAATDPGTIPLHTRVIVRGLGSFWLDDTGGAVNGYHLDVFCTSLRQAYHITGYYTATWRS